MDGWLVFDLVIVVLSWSLESLQIIRAFRIFRALRIITRIETMRNLVAALFDIMPRLGAITALLLLIFYIFGGERGCNVRYLLLDDIPTFGLAPRSFVHEFVRGY